MFKSFLLLSFTFVSTLGLAQSGLQGATNTELLNELARRLDVAGGGAHSQVTFTCDWDVFKVSMITSQGDEKEMSVDLGYKNVCEMYQSLLASKVSKVKELTIVAVCNWDTLHRFALLPDEMKKMAVMDLSYKDACEKAAAEINGKLK